MYATMGLIMEIVASQVFAQNFSLGGGGEVADPRTLYNLMLKSMLQNYVVRTNVT
jgi:hypothetical protein